MAAPIGTGEWGVRGVRCVELAPRRRVGTGDVGRRRRGRDAIRGNEPCGRTVRVPPVSWILLAALTLGLVLALATVAQRRAELHASGAVREERREARRRGSDRPRLQYPFVDLTNCIGCGGCVRACPEEGVLALVHGQAAVVHGSRCVGHGLCSVACPTSAISVTLGDTSDRRDLPALDATFEAVGNPSVFLAGEVTGFALVRTAIGHGVAVADEVARRTDRAPQRDATGPLDLVIVGAGPAGISCALRARERGLKFVVVDQEGLGGTVAKYPRRKMVLTQPVDLPLHGRLEKTSYSKEELIDLWERLVAEHRLPLRTGARYEGLDRVADGTLLVHLAEGDIATRNVCLAIGRRGSPRKLGVPGEELPKVAYHLVDAQSYEDRRILVVGGGDSAIESAIALSEQRGNRVTLSYRKHAFFRIKARNAKRLEQSLSEGRLEILYSSDVERIDPESVQLRLCPEGGATEHVSLPNDDVFVMVGGVPPFRLLEESGVSLSPEDRHPAVLPTEQGTGLLAALATALALTLGVLAFALWRRDYYYDADPVARALHELHGLLRPAGGVGLGAGLLAVVAITANLLYLVRRSRFGTRLPGSLRRWMTSHLVTGILAFLFVALHAGFAHRSTSGGRAFVALAIVVGTGTMGRYLYAFVPRAANGRVMETDEVRTQLAALSGEWDRAGRGEFAQHVRHEIETLVDSRAWGASLGVRIAAVFRESRHLDRTLATLRRRGLAEGVAADRMDELFALGRLAHRTALRAAHYEDLRGLLASWRYMHRWLALAMVLLATLHISTAVRFADLRWAEVWFLRPFLVGGAEMPGGGR